MDLWYAIYLESVAFLSLVVMLLTIPWVLMTKKDSSSALAWCLFVFLVPLFGSLMFLLFGYQHVSRPLKRKRRHKQFFRESNPRSVEDSAIVDSSWAAIARIAMRSDNAPVTLGNDVRFYHDGHKAFEDKYEAIRAARHHVHLEYFIVQRDETGRRLLKLLAEKAKQGVEVRLLYDRMGSRHLNHGVLQEFVQAGGKHSAFMPLNPFRRRFQVNLRNHRKILVVDGKIAFTGGLNIGDEYLGKVERFGYWRDSHLRIEGPAVHELQRIFIEDWDFASDEIVQGSAYFPSITPHGDLPIQVIASGPDQEFKSIREVYFAAMQQARERLWISSPYFVPDGGLLDALCHAGYTGVDVRLICQCYPDKIVPLLAGRYYWTQVLEAGVKVYQYKRGMMHAKVVLVDGEWASVGSANLDNRSLHLNFEANCLIYSTQATAELEAQFLRDQEESIQLDHYVFNQRPMSGKILENACRLLAPVL